MFLITRELLALLPTKKKRDLTLREARSFSVGFEICRESPRSHGNEKERTTIAPFTLDGRLRAR
jgi:hypothetical protein